MFKQTLALAAGIALSVSAVFAHAADVLKVSVPRGFGKTVVLSCYSQAAQTQFIDEDAEADSAFTNRGTNHRRTWTW